MSSRKTLQQRVNDSITLIEDARRHAKAAALFKHYEELNALTELSAILQWRCGSLWPKDAPEPELYEIQQFVRLQLGAHYLTCGIVWVWIDPRRGRTVSTRKTDLQGRTISFKGGYRLATEIEPV